MTISMKNFRFLLIIFCLFSFNTFLWSTSIKYEECEKHICVGYAENGKDCVESKNCKAIVIVTVNYKDDSELKTELYFDLYLTNLDMRKGWYWAAVGLSYDRQMGTDVVVGCTTGPESTVMFHNSFNLGNVSNIIANDNDRVDGVYFRESSLVNSILHCKWTRMKYSKINIKRNNLTINYEIFLLELKYFILLASGNVYSPTAVKYMQHSTLHRKASDSLVGYYLYDKCETSKSFLSKYCFGLNIGSKTQGCHQFGSCDISVVIRRKVDGYSFTFYNQDYPDPNKKIKITIGLSSYANMTNNFTTEITIASIRHVAFKRNNTNVVDVVNGDTVYIYGSHRSMEVEWFLSFDAVVKLFATDKLLYLFVNRYENEYLNWRSKYPIVAVPAPDISIANTCKQKDFECYGFKNSENDGRCLIINDCRVTFLIRETQDAFYLTLNGKVGNDIWIAAAFSNDDKMGDDLVFECMIDNEKLIPKITWNNADKRNLDVVLKQGIKVSDMVVEKNNLTCDYFIKKTFSIELSKQRPNADLKSDDNGIKYNLTNSFKYYILMAIGRVERDGSISSKQKHKESIVSEKMFSRDIQETNITTQLSHDQASESLVIYILIVGIGIFILVVLIVVVVLYHQKSESTGLFGEDKLINKAQEQKFTKEEENKLEDRQPGGIHHLSLHPDASRASSIMTIASSPLNVSIEKKATNKKNRLSI